MLLRVRCVNGEPDELELELPDHEQTVQVAQLKRMVISRVAARESSGVGQDQSLAEAADEHEQVDQAADAQAESFLFFHGKILFDSDFFRLHALHQNDYLVFAWDDEARQQTPVPRPRKRRRVAEELVPQLTAMGFDAEAAAEALCKSANNVNGALAVLMGEDCDAAGAGAQELGGDGDESHELLVEQLLSEHPTLLPIAPLLLQFKPIFELRTLAHTHQFQALQMLRQVLPPTLLDVMTTNPAAMIEFLTMPMEEVVDEDEGDSTAGEYKSPDGTENPDNSHSYGNVTTSEGRSTPSSSAVDRLCSMGFDRDLVVAILESCGQDEEVAVNALLQVSQ